MGKSLLRKRYGMQGSNKPLFTTVCGSFATANRNKDYSKVYLSVVLFLSIIRSTNGLYHDRRFFVQKNILGAYTSHPIKMGYPTCQKMNRIILLFLIKDRGQFATENKSHGQPL